MMMAHVRIQGSTTVQLLGGSPKGRDDVHKLISTWAGWHRKPLPITTPTGEQGSLYQARLWPSTVVPLLEQKTIAIEWPAGTHGALMTVLSGLDGIATELDPPPSHHAPLLWADEWNRQPMPHQVMAIRALGYMHYRALLTDDMGLGKTSSSIWAWQQSGMPRALIVCPKTVKKNWQRELWATLKHVNVYLIEGTPKQRANTCIEIESSRRWNENNIGDALLEQTRGAVIINYDLLHRLPDIERDILKRWVDDQFLICDESHYIKNRKAERTQFVLRNLALPDGGARGRLMLSGTPIRNTTEDLWAQVEVARPGTWSSFHQFDKFHLVRSSMKVDTGKKTRGGVPITKTINVVRRTRNIEQMNAVINTMQVRRKKEDVLDLPPKVFTYPEFDLDPSTAKIYKAMRDCALIELAELGDDTPIFHPQAKSALEATLRLEQIAQGFLGGIPENYLEKVTPLISKTAFKIPGRTGHLVFPKSSKIEWLTETINSIILQGGRPVIFSRFNTPMFWLVKQWEGAAMLHGGLSMPQRDDIIDTFQKGGIPVLFCQVKIAEGFNLTASQDVIFYGRDWSPAINAQAADRCHRIGQTGTVNVQVPIVSKTFEVYLHKKLRAKEADAEQALRRITIGELRNAL
jgi:SNF2 family DNA or RNA helicase